jgi:hypothetical protein
LSPVLLLLFFWLSFLLLLLLLCFLLLTWFKTDLLTNNYCASSWRFTTKLLALARKKGFCYAISLVLFLGLFPVSRLFPLFSFRL